MNEKQKAKIIIKTLNKIYPKAPVPLKSKNTFTLLISVLLSAQCTDVNVNNVTKDIYPKYYKPEHFVKLGRKKIEKLIKKIGIFRVKAKSIFLLSKQVLEKHKGEVPKTFEELEKLPGVGHKTASVVMSQGFGYPAFPIDTHIHRLAQRWGLTNGKFIQQLFTESFSGPSAKLYLQFNHNHHAVMYDLLCYSIYSSINYKYISYSCIWCTCFRRSTSSVIFANLDKREIFSE